MKVAVLTPYFLPYMGGAEVGIHHIASGLCRRHQVHLLVPQDTSGALYPPWQEAQNQDWERQAPYAVTRFAEHLSRLRLSASRKGLLSWIPPVSLRIGRILDEQVAAFGPDVVLCFYALPFGRAAGTWGLRTGVPVCLSIMGGEIAGPGSKLFWPLHIRAAVRRCTHTIYETPFCARAALGGPLSRRILPIPPPSHIVPFGVDLALFRPEADGAAVRRQWGVARDEPLLVTVSRLAQVKNVELQLHALAHLVSTHPGIRLMVVGSGNWEQNLRRLAGDLGLADRVLFAGFVAPEQLPPYYQAGDLFTYSSRFETFGMVLAEAMACGTPQVAVGRTAVADVVVHGETGLLVPDFDARAMAEAVRTLLADPRRRAAMALASVALARREFSWDSVVDRYDQTLVRLVEQARRDSGSAP
ncbi:MAG: glycosyltransferase family 4 protein [Gemmatimonadota bacterium]